MGRAVLTALETSHRRQVLGRLAHAPVGPTPPPQAQIVCCIDVRSEGLRRRIESVGPYDTIGFAGFFATAMNYRALGSAAAVPLAPALVSPEIEVREVPDDDVAPASVADRRQRRARAAATVEDTGHSGLAMFALAEAAGWVLGPRALLATLAPGQRPRGATSVAGRIEPDDGKARRRCRPLPGGAGPRGRDRPAHDGPDRRLRATRRALRPPIDDHGQPPRRRARLWRLWRQSGRGQRPGRGGHPERPGGAHRRWPIGASRSRTTTWFVAGEHDTTTDEVTLLDRDAGPTEHGDAMRRSRVTWLRRRDSARGRLAGLPGGRSRIDRPVPPGGAGPAGGLGPDPTRMGPGRERRVHRGAPVPHHGRSTWAAPSCTPMTREDADGTALETILTAPMVVAHWISRGYYFSTVAPGSGAPATRCCTTPCRASACSSASAVTCGRGCRGSRWPTSGRSPRAGAAPDARRRRRSSASTPSSPATRCSNSSSTVRGCTSVCSNLGLIRQPDGGCAGPAGAGSTRPTPPRPRSTIVTHPRLDRDDEARGGRSR